jgi:Ni,Fe-hydrogenase I small subunit
MCSLSFCTQSRVMTSAAFKATSIRSMATVTGKVKWFNVAKVCGCSDSLRRCRRNAVIHGVVWL